MYGGSDPLLIGKPLAIDYNPAVFEEFVPDDEVVDEDIDEPASQQTENVETLH